MALITASFELQKPWALDGVALPESLLWSPLAWGGKCALLSELLGRRRPCTTAQIVRVYRVRIVPAVLRLSSPHRALALEQGLAIH